MATKVEIAKARVAEMEAEIKKAREQMAALELKANARKKETDRTMRERQKYIVGEYIMKRFDLGDDQEFTADIMARLDAYLHRPSDRRRFGLQELPKAPKTGNPEPASSNASATPNTPRQFATT